MTEKQKEYLQAHPEWEKRLFELYVAIAGGRAAADKACLNAIVAYKHAVKALEQYNEEFAEAGKIYTTAE